MRRDYDASLRFAFTSYITVKSLVSGVFQPSAPTLNSPLPECWFNLQASSFRLPTTAPSSPTSSVNLRSTFLYAVNLIGDHKEILGIYTCLASGGSNRSRGAYGRKLCSIITFTNSVEVK